METRKYSSRSKIIFRYAGVVEVLLMLLGFVFGAVSGLVLPLVILVFGYALDDFASYDLLQRVRESNMTNASDFCSLSDFVSKHYFDSLDIAETLKSEAQYYTYNTIGLAVIVLVSSSLSRILWAIAGARQAKEIRLSFLKSVLTRQIGWYDMHSVAEIPTHLSDCIPQMEKAIGTHTSSLFQDGVTFISCFIIALAVNWELTLITSILVPVIFVIVIAISRVIQKVSVRQTKALKQAGAVAEEVLSAIKTVVAFGGQEKEIHRYHSHLKILKKQSVIVLFLTSLMLSFMAMMILQYFALGFWYASRLFVECSIKPGEMLIVIAEVMLGTFTLAELLPEFKEFSEAKGKSTEVFEIIDQGSDIDGLSPDGETIDDFKGGIEFRDVTFSYPSRNELRVLQGLDLKINPGQTIALVGATGSGKSTIMKLLPRIYEYNTGNILIDGKEIRTLNVSWLRNQIGIVSQEPILFNVTVAENIGYGKKNASQEEIEEAARLANAHDFINKLEFKYQTIVGEGGSQISGGQKQRIAIARALIRNPKILLLDEATSALDTESEQIIQQALDKAREGRTTIIIAHRLSTIRSADVIVGISEGQVKEMGNHSELMERKGLYYDLIMSQTAEETDGSEDESTKDFSDALLQKPSYMRETSITNGSLTGSLNRRRATIGSVAHYKSTKSSTLASRAGGTLPRNAETQINVEHALTNVGEMQNPFEGFEDRTVLSQLKDSLVTIKDLLVLSLRWNHWLLLTIALVTFVLSGAFFTFNFAVVKELVEQFREFEKKEVLNGVDEQTIWFTSIGFIIFVLYIIGISTFSFVGEQVVEVARVRSFRSMVKQRMEWFDEKENSVSILTNDLTTQAKDIFQLFDIRMGSSLRSFVTTVGVIILSFQISWVMGFVVFPAYVFMFVGAFLQVALAKKYADQSSHRTAEIAQITTEYIENVLTVTMLSIEKTVVDKYEELLVAPANDNLKSAATNGILLGASKALVYFFIGIGYVVGGHIVTADSSEVYYSDIAEIFTVIFIILLVNRMFKTAFNALPDVHKAFVSADGVVFIVNQHIPDSFGKILETVDGKVTFQNVHFSYPTAEEVKILRGLTISVEPGKTVALVGPSGSGKSTTIALLEKFYNPTSQSSRITLDGEDIKGLKNSWLRQQFSLVSQEPVLFKMSIADNIRYGANFREVTDEEIHEAAKSANIHEFIMSLKDGYNTDVGSKGSLMSGGEKQRIAIARALVRNPKILLLDEATSALDTESERVVQEALDKASEGRTTIVIAHRLSTIQNADCICVLHKGRVIEKGTHSELMRKKGAYYRLHTNYNELDRINNS